MSRYTDYIPTKDGDLLTWSNTLFDGVIEHAAEWGIAPKTWTEVIALMTTYDVALSKAKDPNHGHADILEKNTARDALKKAVRQYVKEYLIANSAISDDELKRIGLPVHDTHHTPVNPPDSIPLAKVKLSSPGVLEWFVIDSKSGKKAKPKGVSGFELVWGIFEVVPNDWAQLTHSAFSTRATLKLSFSGNERGKVIAYATRWENTKGQKGPWSDIESAIIP
jgi:hypothetical protein